MFRSCPHQRRDDKGAVEHQLTRCSPVEVAHPPKRIAGEAPGHPTPFPRRRRSRLERVPWTRTVTRASEPTEAANPPGRRTREGEISTFPAAKWRFPMSGVDAGPAFRSVTASAALATSRMERSRSVGVGQDANRIVEATETTRIAGGRASSITERRNGFRPDRRWRRSGNRRTCGAPRLHHLPVDQRQSMRASTRASATSPALSAFFFACPPES